MSDSLFRTEAMVAARTSGFGQAVFYQPVTLRLLVAGLLIVFLTLLLFASLADIRQTERVRGHLTGMGGETKMYSGRTGVVTEVRVRDGDTVAAGDIVATVSEFQFDAQGLRTSTVLRKEIDRQIRQIDQRRQAVEQRYTAEYQQLNDRFQGMRSELELRQQELALLAKRVDISAKEYEASRSLRDSAAISSREYRQAASALYSLQQQEKSAQLAIEGHRRAMSELNQQIYIHPLQLAEERLALEQSRSQLTARHHELLTGESMTITAPKPGIVSNVVIRPGDHADPRVPVMTLLHPDDELEAWLYLPSRALAKIAAGTEVMIAYDAYPYQTWGNYQARITMVSESVMDPREYLLPQNLQEPVYLARASLISQTVVIPDASEERLRAGMSLSADIVTGSETLMQKLLSPLRGVRQKL